MIIHIERSTWVRFTADPDENIIYSSKRDMQEKINMSTIKSDCKQLDEKLISTFCHKEIS